MPLHDENIASQADIAPSKIRGGGYHMTSLWGLTFYVDSNNGDDQRNSGLRIGAPFKTWAKALANCRNNKGDVIHIAPAHAETLTGNPSMTWNKSCTVTIGHGRYNKMPTFLLDGANTAHFLITGADSVFHNLRFNAGHADVAKAIQVQAKGVHIDQCFFTSITTDENFLIAVNVAVADDDSDGVAVTNCVMHQLDAASTHAVYFVKNTADALVQGNHICGDYVADTAIVGAGAAEICLNLRVIGNFIHNVSGDSEHAIEFAAANTGVLAHNSSGDVDGDGTPIIGTGMSLVENYHTGAVTKSGFLYPAADT